jgi:uncharacterized protein YdaU (DUF1376 family)
MAIQKPEWFKMDPAKFLCDAQVDVMSTLELGACLRLLCRQWIDGFIPDDLHLLARLCRLDAVAMGEAWVTLSRFFPVVESGKRANRFMWIERETIVADLEKRSDEGTKAARKRWDEVKKRQDAIPNGSPMPEAMQDQTRPEQTRVEKSFSSEQQTRSDEMTPQTQKKTSKAPSQEACRLVALLKSEILRNKPDYRVTPAQERKWETTAQRMLDIDRRNSEQIANVIRWVQRDEFEMANVLCMDKLRKRFDQLELKADAKSPKRTAVSPLPASYVPASEKIRQELLERSAGGMQ